MEGRMKKYGQLSPDRAKVWKEKSGKYEQSRKVGVVYYLCRNGQLQHPHFIQIPLSSPHGLYLRDVINKLNVVRGRGMASMYSWSCKRSYKNGFVWHDLSEDDLILPAQGNEYVLKGSQIFEQSNSDIIQPNQKQLQQQTFSRIQDDSSSSTSTNTNETKNHQDEEFTPESKHGKNSTWTGSLNLTEYKIYKSDASTQTEPTKIKQKSQKNCTRGVSTDDSGSPENPVVPVSPPPSSSESSSGGKTDTLESLIRTDADASKLNSFRVSEHDEEFTNRIRPSNMLMQLISCGSISVKDHHHHSFDFVSNYRPKFSNSIMLEEKEYFSGSLVETNLPKTEGISTLKRSSSYNADRSCKQFDDSVKEKDETSSSTLKCIPRAIKASLSKQPRSELMRSPISDGPRISSDGPSSSRTISACTSNGSSKRFIEGKKQSTRLDSFREEKENVIKFEERLASGARVIIQSKAPIEIEGNSWD